MLEALRLVRDALPEEKALIGFSGAPFTLATYLIEGGPSRNYTTTKAMMYGQACSVGRPDEPAQRHDHRLPAGPGGRRSPDAATLRQLGRLVEQAGLQQNTSFRTPAGYSARSKRPDVPVVHFATGSGGLNEVIKDSGADVIGLDWRVPLDEAWESLGSVAVQGQPGPRRTARAS